MSSTSSAGGISSAWLAFYPQSYGDESRATVRCRHLWSCLFLGGSLFSLGRTVRGAQPAQGRSTRSERPDVCKREKIYAHCWFGGIPVSLRVCVQPMAVQILARHSGRSCLGDHCWGAFTRHLTLLSEKAAQLTENRGKCPTRSCSSSSTRS